jgi:hypothetical protein
MDSANTQVVPVPPSLMKSLMAGFDAVSNHIELLLFPILVDLFLWIGPHVRILGLLQTALQQPELIAAAPDAGVRKALLDQAGRLNLLANLRSLPVGVPSLMTGRGPLDSPLPPLFTWDVPNLTTAAGLWLLFTLIGLAIGTFYYEMVVQAATSGRVSLRLSVDRWAREYLHVLFLGLAWFVLVAVLFVPFSCVLSVLVLSGVSFETLSVIGFLLIGGVLIWLLTPMAFSAHGIFVYQQNMPASMMQSLKMSRWTFVMTGLFLLAVVVLSQGLNLLWNAPADTSWFLLLGILGHAFVTTALLAGSIVYYRDVNQWIQNLLQYRATRVA